MTFSITARCPDTRMLGIAVSTKLLCVGALCPFAQAGAGAIATQSFVNPYIGIKGLTYLAGGMDAVTARDLLAAGDEGRDVRQFAIVDTQGRVATYSGVSCVDWFGDHAGDGYAVAGNMLVGEPTITQMVAAFEASRGAHLAERLVGALEAGQAAGGDKRGRQSAALKVVHTEEYPLIDIRVDDHADPVAELRRVWDMYAIDRLPFMDRIPTKANPLGVINRD